MIAVMINVGRPANMITAPVLLRAAHWKDRRARSTAYLDDLGRHSTADRIAVFKEA